MNMRKITSLTALVSFILEILTSVILYIVPQGRIAYWADWHLWGLTKTQWTDLHLNLGVLFLLAMCLHIYYNWNPITAYLKNKARQLRVFTKEFNAALILTTIFLLGTYFLIPPFSTIIEISNSIKDKAARHYGEPPYGHAELSSLKTFVGKVGLDLEDSMKRLRQEGITFTDESQSLADIAKLNKLPPQQIYAVMKPALSETAEITFPENPPPGFGHRSLADICHEYDLNIKIILRGLADKGIKAKEELTPKAIAADNGTSPMDIFEMMKEIVKKSTAQP